MTIMTPMLALIGWTFLMFFWLGYQRVPKLIANAKKGTPPPKRTQDISGLPDKAVWAADNYNHLHEQPVLFYALCVYSHLVGVADPINIGLAWGYVLVRIVHSIIQCTQNVVLWRFRVFLLGSFLLIAMLVRNAIALF
jgi:hypothetical protein